MRKSLFTALATAGILVAAISGVMAASMVLNEFNAVAADGYLKKEKVDPYFGRVQGNGGSWAEFVVIEDNLDITGWTFMSFIDGGLASTVVIEGAGYDNLAAGTLFTVAATVQETGSGWWSNYYAPDFVTGSTNCQIIIMDANGDVVFGPAGEGVMPAKGIGSDEIFVFTPTGELRILPAGSSVLDFAFNIHTGIGLRCTGGKVGGKAVPIKHKLQTGDVVEILTGKNQKPSQDWLNFVVSSKARGKIRQVLHEAELQQAAEGKELLQRRLKNWKMEFPDDMVGEFMKKFRYPSIKEIYAAIGAGTLDINVIKNFILEADARAAEALEAAREAEAAKERWKAENAGDEGDMLVLDSAHVKGLDYKMARCCNPVFGDDVFGFVTREGGIKIHRISCPNAARLLELYPYRIQKVRWAQHPAGGSFQATLRVSAAMESWVINQIMDVMNTFKTSLRSFNVSENPRNGTYDITMKISVPSNMELDKVVSQLRAQKNVLKVSRS